MKKINLNEIRSKLQKKNPNAVYWNWIITGEEDHEQNKIIEYRFLIANQDARTVQGVYSRIAEYLGNVREETKLLEGIHQGKDGKDYHYLLIKLEATKGPNPLANFPSNIYTRVNQDRKLTDHRDDDSLKQYARGKLEEILGSELP